MVPLPWLRPRALALLLLSSLLAAACFPSPPDSGRAALTPVVPPPISDLGGQQFVSEQNAVELAVTAVAAIPTQATAPAAPPAPIAGRLLLATTRPSPRPKSDLPIDYRLAVLSSRGLEVVDLPSAEAGVVAAAVNRDGDAVAILGGDRLLRFRLGTDAFADVLPWHGPTPPGQAARFLAVEWLTTRQLLVRQPGPPTLFTIELDGSNQRPLPGTGLNAVPSPDGTQLAMGFVRDELFYSIHLSDLAFSQPRKLTPDAVTEASPAWSPDGQWIAYAANAGFADRPTPTVAWEIRAIRPDGSGQRTLVSRTPGVSYPDIRWSPDSSRIAFTRFNQAAKTRHVAVVGLDGSGLTTLSDAAANDRVLAWLP